jgi:hypothetical protein
MLAPAQPMRLVGGEALVIGLVVWVAILVIDIRNSRKKVFLDSWVLLVEIDR